MRIITSDDGFCYSPDLLTTLLTLWISHYKELSIETYVSQKDGKPAPSEMEVVQRINSGDCGTTAIGVGYAYQQLMSEFIGQHQRVLPIEFMDNLNHAYLKLNGICYDTINIEGTANESSIFEYDAPNMQIESLTLKELFRRYVYIDFIGSMYIRRFCQRLHIATLTEADVVIAKNTDKSNYTMSWVLWLDGMMDNVNEFRKKPDPKLGKSEALESVFNSLETGESQ